MLDIANKQSKGNQRTAPCISSNDDRFSQLIVDIVSAVLDGNRAAALPAGDHGHRLAGIAAQGKQKCIEFFVISVDPLNDILLAFFRYG